MPVRRSSNPLEPEYYSPSPELPYSVPTPRRDGAEAKHSEEQRSNAVDPPPAPPPRPRPRLEEPTRSVLTHQRRKNPKGKEAHSQRPRVKGSIPPELFYGLPRRSNGRRMTVNGGRKTFRTPQIFSHSPSWLSAPQPGSIREKEKGKKASEGFQKAPEPTCVSSGSSSPQLGHLPAKSNAAEDLDRGSRTAQRPGSLEKPSSATAAPVRKRKRAREAFEKRSQALSGSLATSSPLTASPLTSDSKGKIREFVAVVVPRRSVDLGASLLCRHSPQCRADSRTPCKHSQSNDLDLVRPDGCHHYEAEDGIPSNLRKYFDQRFNIWSLYEFDVWMTNDAWFGVTPEPIAKRIAEHVARVTPKSKTVIIDAFGGVGGNAIAFALSGRWERVYAIEKDHEALACGKHNALVYDVGNRISWYEGDCFEVLNNHLQGLRDRAVVFGSPPWGGPGYAKDRIFDLTQMEPYNLPYLIDSFRTFTHDVVLYLPRNSDILQIGEYHEEGKRVNVVHYCMCGASKALCAYFGDFERP